MSGVALPVRAPRRRVAAAPRARAVLGALGVLAAAGLSALVLAPAPDYDPWMWLLWGREVASGTLSTAGGPAFKPLPVAVCALLAPLGSAAPAAWVLLARAAALAALWPAFRLGARLGGGSLAAGLLAAVGVALCGGYPAYAAGGLAEGMLLCLALAGAEAWRARRPRLALACGVACGLLRVEAWPFLLAAGVVLWRRRPQDRALLAACALAVPALWLGPEWLGSGDPLRSGARARVPNPGQPALADVPALASLGAAAALPLWPLWAGVVALAAARARAALLPAAAGGVWIALVAAMAQAGFSGEARYALPGAALVAVSGAVGLARLGRSRARAAAVLVLLAAAAAPRLADLGDVHARQAHRAALAADLRAAVAAAGGRADVLACGRPYTGEYRGPLTAYVLHVPKRAVGFAPRAPGVVLRSPLDPGAAPAPDAPAPFASVARAGLWEVLAACRVRVP
jgi:hypothetical protein